MSYEPARIEAAARPLLERWLYVLVLAGGECLLPYTAARRERLLTLNPYGPDFPPFLQRFLSALRHADWPPGNYFPGGWFRALQTQGLDPASVPIVPERLGPYFGEQVLVDAAGRWRVGTKPVQGRVLAFFLRRLHFDPDVERYFIGYRLEGRPEVRYLRHESPPWRVRAVAMDAWPPVLLLNDGTQEPLRLDTLRLDAGEALYCAVKAEALPARFEDGARYQILQHVEERAEGWVLERAGRAWPLAWSDPWPGAGRLPTG
jgi:hypothetical protein